MIQRGATCYLNSLIQVLYMTPQVRSSILSLDLEKQYSRTQLTNNGDNSTSFEEVTIDFSTFPFYSQLIDMGFPNDLINKAFHKFVEPSDTTDTDVNSRTQENMIMWLFEEQDNQSSSESIVPLICDHNDGEIIGSIFDNTIGVDLSLETTKEVTSLKIIKKKKKKKQPNLLLVMQKLFSYMMKIEKPSVETTELTDAFGWQTKHVSMQHDIQELSRVFFQALETKLSKMKKDNFIKDIFCGSIINKTVCKECGNVSCMEEDFYDLTLTVEKSLEESLKKYVSFERFEGNNQYSCSKCNKKVELAVRNTTIKRLPPILFFSLSRFEYDWKTESRVKIKQEMTFNSVVDMSPFTENPVENTPEEYELFSVIVHTGSPFCGHYYCLINDLLEEGNFNVEDERNDEKKKNKKAFETETDQHWFEFNDERVFSVNSKEEIPKYFGGKGATACT